MNKRADPECARCGDRAVFWFDGEGGFFYSCGDNDCLLYATTWAETPLPGGAEQ